MKTLQWWNETEKRLGEKLDKKVKELVNLELIDPAPPEAPHAYVVRPIPGYNSTTYRLTRCDDGTFSCSCQGYAARGKCAHQRALQITLFNRCSTADLFK